MAGQVVRKAAAEAANRWGEPSLQVDAVIGGAMQEAAREARERVRDEVRSLRDGLRELVDGLHPHGGPTRRAQIDGFTIDFLALPEWVVPELRTMARPAPGWMRWFRGSLERWLVRRLRATYESAIEEAARVFATDLREWARKALARLAEQVAAEVEPFRASALSGVADADAVQADLRRIEPPPAHRNAGERGARAPS